MQRAQVLLLLLLLLLLYNCCLYLHLHLLHELLQGLAHCLCLLWGLRMQQH